jgi:hypothetical protein
MRGAATHHGQDGTFETLLRPQDLDDPVLWRIAAIVYEADREHDPGTTHPRLSASAA